MNERAGPERPAQAQVSPSSSTTAIVPDQDVHRRRQVQRLATIALVRALYGPAADARLVPPGPDVCPDGCPWCPPRPRPDEPMHMAWSATGSA
jgi:hypothetical protein